MSHAANSLLVTSDAGLALIKAFEGLETAAYPDPGNRITGEPWTIGYGHTRGVRRGDTCTEEQATAFSNSTLLRLLNAGDVAAAAGQFKRWNRGGDGVLPGLVRRRAAERDLFISQETG